MGSMGVPHSLLLHAWWLGGGAAWHASVPSIRLFMR
jgi:hypothetical protein